MGGGMFVLLIACGITAGIVASNKGRSVAGWCFLGVALGPIGVLMAIVVSRNEAEIESRAIRFGKGRKCPSCAELVKPEATVCKHCGGALEPVEAPKTVAPETKEDLFERRARNAAYY